MGDYDRDEFLSDLRLDPDQLDVECVRQPEAFFRWAERLVEAKTEVDRLELAAEVLEAQLQNQVRREPATHGVEKETEAGFKAAVAQNPKLVSAKEQHIEAKRVAALLEKGVAGMEQKKRMLESLITLHGQNYFSGPSAPRDLSKAWRRFQSPVVVQQKKLARKREHKG